jgi:hypothetical protein
MRQQQTDRQQFVGIAIAVKARIRLLRSFNQMSHAYRGYTLLLDGAVDREPADELRIGAGPKAHERHQFRIGDQVTGLAVPVPDGREEWSTHHKVSRLRVLEHGPGDQYAPANPEGGIAPRLPEYRSRGHRRLDKRTYSWSCQRCPFGLVMATEIIIDQWNPGRKPWRFETHCYGPRDCPRYHAGQPYHGQGRKPYMVRVDDDVEREEAEAEFPVDDG